MRQLLDGKIIVLIGGVGLLGRSFVQAVLEESGTAVLADLDEKNGRELVRKLSQELKSEKVDFFRADIVSKDSLQQLIHSVKEKYGAIHAVVDCAYPRNKNYGKKFEEVNFNDFCENMNMHLGGYFLVSQQFAQFFKSQGEGNVVNIASIYGMMAPRFEIYENTTMTMPVEYAAIKSAIIHLTRYMAKYHKGSNIRFNCISPGGIMDGQPLEFLEKYRSYALSKGMLDRADVNGTLIYLLSDLSLFVNGQNITVDDGFSL